MKKFVVLFMAIAFLATFTLMGCQKAEQPAPAPEAAAPAPEAAAPAPEKAAPTPAAPTPAPAKK